MIHERDEFNFHRFIERIAEMSYEQMITTADSRMREVESISYRVRGATEARKLGSERFVQQLKNLCWYLNSNGLEKPPFARHGEVLAYCPIATKLVERGRWSAGALKLFPATQGYETATRRNALSAA